MQQRSHSSQTGSHRTRASAEARVYRLAGAAVCVAVTALACALRSVDAAVMFLATVVVLAVERVDRSLKERR